MSFIQAGDAIAALVAKTIDKSLKIAAAQRVLRDEAETEGLHPMCVTILTQFSDAIEVHPDPAKLLEGRMDQLNYEIARTNAPEGWPEGMTAVDIVCTAEAFGRAARVIRGT